MAEDQWLVPWRLASIELGVENVETATTFWTKFGGLDVSEQKDGRTYLRAGTDHHWVALTEADGEPGMRTMSFEVRSDKDLDAFNERLTAAGVETRPVTHPWSGPGIEFSDPSGLHVELITRMGHIPVSPRGKWFTPQAMLHTVVAVTDLQESFEFYTEVLGFRESDRVLGRTIFLRGGIGWHHSLVIVGQRGEPHLDHVAFLLDGFDDLMRARAFAMDGGVPLARDLLRHPTSGSASIYLTAEPSSVMLELCFDHARITDPNHRPRGLTLNQWANNVWLPPKG